ncbi:MAG: diphthamide biosynthesis enzyme Dph2 [Candidatus Aenigmarchaeota archaeon]|nr:diphthamide biosynthesis enzyme Dph2 [Candidatus Aenigmarchaeota archaeon]
MLRDLVQKIKERNPKRVFIQLPEGLITRAQEIEKLLDDEGIESFVSLEPCYGACDLRDCEAERLGCDLLVHVGHSDFGLKSRIPVLYYEWRIEFDPVPILEKSMDKLGSFKNIGLVASVNYLDSIEAVKEYLEDNGKNCFVGKGERARYPGQVLGCDPSAGLSVEKDVECFIFIGSGVFHPLGLALKTNKPVFSIDVERMGLFEVEKDTFVRQSIVATERARDATKFGILVSTKPGQMQTELALSIKKKLESKGKEAYIFTMDNISPDKLMGLDVDCYVNCACPRIAIENRAQFKKSILNPDELIEIL